MKRNEVYQKWFSFCPAEKLSQDETSNLPFNSNKSSAEALPAVEKMN